MKSVWIGLFGSLGLALSVVGCGSNNSSTQGQDLVQEAQNQATAQGNPAIQTASYATDCSANAYDVGTIKFPGFRTEYDMSDLKFDRKELYYSDSCQTMSFYVQEQGILKVVDKSTTEQNALDEDFTFQQTILFVTNDATVTAFNTAKVCGFTDWSLNVGKDVSAQAGGLLCPGKSANRVATEVVLVDGTNFYLGDDTGATTRPTKVDRSKTFKKQ